jgi:hypothetical protein
MRCNARPRHRASEGAAQAASADRFLGIDDDDEELDEPSEVCPCLWPDDDVQLARFGFLRYGSGGRSREVVANNRDLKLSRRSVERYLDLPRFLTAGRRPPLTRSSSATTSSNRDQSFSGPRRPDPR